MRTDLHRVLQWFQRFIVYLISNFVDVKEIMPANLMQIQEQFLIYIYKYYLLNPFGKTGGYDQKLCLIAGHRATQ